ncbi:acyltransferase [Colletotrichum scovillei]|uniref:Acetyltransferase n=1 Tax=Colletotrichum scovillei TaxID=1209932 RepID=A0A9P7REM5_9PEZI|nr:acyltransferase [Colletotrichum scovillei]KAF4785354.1 acyltransferase [Colletotrichum scovillei]KAG7055911.1 acetyltransferase [Colletotrichum scovillei]KAG7075314.1 acetyltransferase [Colletotrichum scovillei]KAG7082302.1 acetyltransferase [Colletotrichum scovillei]
MPLESPLQGYDRTNNPITAIMATDVHKTDAKGDAKSDTKVPAPAPNAGLVRKPSDPHPAGRVKHSLVVQVLRGFSFGVYFAACCLAIITTQLLGVPLYWANRDMFYSYMALTKQSFGLTITAMTHIWSSTTIRISGDASMNGQIQKTADGRVQFNFPERVVLIANHQIYTDWLYLWWVAYANSPSMHGHIYIILKESLKYIPGVGAGMMFYGFIFMSRKMSTDQPRLAHRLQKLKKQHIGANGNKYLDPMWLLLFPEGTNLSTNGRRKSAAWAKKNDLKDPEHVLLPRSTGTFFCLNELKGSLDYVYDCTVAYEGVPRGKFGDQFFTLTSTYFQGRPPKSVNFHWRRFRLADIPLDDAKVFDTWLRERWYEKDAIMEEYLSTGRFPASQDLKGGFVETEVRLKSWIELGQIFVVLGIAGLVLRIVANSITRFASVL